MHIASPFFIHRAILTVSLHFVWDSFVIDIMHWGGQRERDGEIDGRVMFFRSVAWRLFRVLLSVSRGPLFVHLSIFIGIVRD